MSVGIPFGRYRLLRRLARGGMAEVFLSTQQGPGEFERIVAIKRILPHLADIPQFLEMFTDEARLASQLSHPNIAHIYEFGNVDDSYFIAMEYIDGIDLSVIVIEGMKRPLPFEHAARIIADVCAALHYAHKLTGPDGTGLGIVHRDISPQNVLVSFDGAVKVVDFGIAKAAFHIERTKPGVVRGKYTYMSPEQVLGKPLDGRSDLFSAGIVLYELCTASALFPRNDAVQSMQLIRDAQVPTPMRDGKPIPKQLGKIIKRSLAKNREDRYQTAAEMQLELEEFLKTSSKISNSIVLGEYFKQHYRKLRPPPNTALELKIQSGNGPNRPISHPSTLPVEGANLAVNGSVLALEKQQQPAPPPIPAVSGEIFVQPTAIKQKSASTANPSPDDEAETKGFTSGVSPNSKTAAKLKQAPGNIIWTRSSPVVTPIVTSQAASRKKMVLAISLLVFSIAAVFFTVIWFKRFDRPPSSMKFTTLPDIRTAMVNPKADADLKNQREMRVKKSLPGVISIVTQPVGATVQVDGERIPGITPVQKELPSGDYQLTIHYPGFQEQREHAHIVEGEKLRLNIVLSPVQPGKQKELIAALPRHEKQHKSAKHIKSRRRHHPHLKRHGRRQLRKRVRPNQDRITVKTIKPNLPPPEFPPDASGYITITTIPWSWVYLDGKKIGMSPLANYQTKAGNHQLRFLNPELSAIKRVVKVLPGKVTKIRIDLRNP